MHVADDSSRDVPRHVLIVEGEALRRRFEEYLDARDPEDLVEPEAA